MKKLQMAFAAFILVAMSAFVLVPVSTVAAADALDTICETNPGDSAVCDNKDDSTDSLVGAIINNLLFITGVISVIVIIIAGIMYTLSQGNSASVTKAKNALFYAIVGVIVSFLAYAIINWVYKLF